MAMQQLIENFIAGARVIHAVVVIGIIRVHIVMPENSVSPKNPRRIPEKVRADSHECSGITNFQSLVNCQDYASLAIHLAS